MQGGLGTAHKQQHNGTTLLQAIQVVIQNGKSKLLSLQNKRCCQQQTLSSKIGHFQFDRENDLENTLKPALTFAQIPVKPGRKGLTAATPLRASYYKYYKKAKRRKRAKQVRRGAFYFAASTDVSYHGGIFCEQFTFTTSICRLFLGVE